VRLMDKVNFLEIMDCSGCGNPDANFKGFKIRSQSLRTINLATSSYAKKLASAVSSLAKKFSKYLCICKAKVCEPHGCQNSGI